MGNAGRPDGAAALGRLYAGHEYPAKIEQTRNGDSSMLDMFAKRALQSVLVLFLMSVLAFVGINLVGDPIYLLVPPDATQAEIVRATKALGLDLPVHEQYWRFVVNALRGELGDSFVFNRPAVALIFERMP